MIHLITGGSGSGKSVFAEKKLLEFSCNEKANPRVYIATMHIGEDAENQRRVDIHRERRKDMGFTTVEAATSLATCQIPEHADVLLEDISNLVANELFMPGASGIHAVNAVLDGIHHILNHADNLVIVTNEVFSDGVAYDNTTRLYLQLIGAINQELARMADQVTEVVYGIPVIHKTQGEQA